jgi:hypothetical protein
VPAPVVSHTGPGDLDDPGWEQLVVGPALIEQEGFRHKIRPLGGLEVSEALGPTLNDSADRITESISGVACVDLLLEPDRGVLLPRPVAPRIITSRLAVS